MNTYILYNTYIQEKKSYCYCVSSHGELYHVVEMS